MSDKDAGALETGVLWSALGAGMLVSSTWLASLAHNDLVKRITLIFRFMVVGGVAICGLSLMSALLIAGAFILIIGGSTALFMPIVWGVLQEITPRGCSPASSRPSAPVPWHSQWPAWLDSAGLPIPWVPTSVCSESDSYS